MRNGPPGARWALAFFIIAIVDTVIAEPVLASICASSTVIIIVIMDCAKWIVGEMRRGG
jgi:hypothetical protein